MSEALLGDVLTAVAAGRPSPTWTAGADRIHADRDAVRALLAGGETLYGFSTRLGQYDVETAPSDADARFLSEHLVGWLFPMPDSFARLLSATKAMQLARGGTGITPELYDAICAHAVATTGDSPVSGAWLDSYGAADVVPAAWWLRHVLDRSDAHLASGDFIAAVSGSFISTGAAIAALLRSTAVIARWLAFVPPTDRALWLPPRSERESTVRVLLDGEPGGAQVQAPISLRDATPMVTGVVGASDRLVAAIARRLAHPSGNPLIVTDERRPRAVSQNRYLDFELTDAARGLAQSLSLVIGHMQRMCEHAFAAHRSPALVQIPKLAQAVVERARPLLAAPAHTSHQSEGVEDVYDMSLDAATRLVVLTRFAERSLALVERFGPPLRDTALVEDALWQGIATTRPAPEVHAAWAGALAAGWSGDGDPAPAPVVA